LSSLSSLASRWSLVNAGWQTLNQSRTSFGYRNLNKKKNVLEF